MAETLARVGRAVKKLSRRFPELGPHGLPDDQQAILDIVRGFPPAALVVCPEAALFLAAELNREEIALRRPPKKKQRQ